MNRIKLLLLSAICATTASAQLNGDGYYRVQNVAQGRYINVVDDRGSINVSTQNADMAALRTVDGFERIVSDPGSIIYFKKMNEGYDLMSQGTGSYSIISYEVRIQDLGDGTYWCYASKAGMTKYLADELISFLTVGDKRIYGQVVTNSNDTRDWYIKPVSATGEEYFGLTPDVTVGNDHYKSFVASFPYSFASNGMKGYTISSVDEAKGVAVWQEVSGTIAAATPIIIKCPSTEASGNRLNIGGGTPKMGKKPITSAGNRLVGVYFCNPNGGDVHTNVVNYDPATMRVLGTTVSGHLAFIKATGLQYIPANSTYITVSASAPDVLYVVDANDTSLNGIKGDLNGDGEVNVTDYVELNNMLQGTQAASIAADLNKDGQVDATDLATLTELVNAGNVTAGTATGTPQLTFGELAIKAGETGTLAINLTNPGFAVTALQFDIALPAGLTLNELTPQTGRLVNHIMTQNTVNGQLRVILRSAQNTAIAGTEGAILNLSVTAAKEFVAGTATMNNIVLASTTAQQHKTVAASYDIVAEKEPEPLVKGDVNQDGEVNVTDYIMLSNMIRGITEAPWWADLNQDGQLNEGDLAYLMAIVNSAAVTAGTAIGNPQLTISEVSIKAGESATVSLNLTNGDFAVSALQFDIALPAGITLDQISMTERLANHQLSYSTVDGLLRIILTNTQNAAITGTEGAILTLAVTAADDFEAGTVTLSNIVMANASAQQHKTVAVSYDIVAEKEPEPVKGDLNGDFIVDQQDFDIITDMVLGKTDATEEADLNEDGTVNLDDLAEMARIINAPEATAQAAPENTKLFFEEFAMDADQTQEVSIVLENPDFQVWQAQFDIRMPETMSIVESEGITLLRNSADSHQLGTIQQDNVTTVVVYTNSLQNIEGTDGALLKLTVKTAADFEEGIVRLENIKLVQQQGETVQIADSELTVTTTGIDDITLDNGQHVKVYNLQGQRVNGQALNKGVYIVNGKKVIRN